MIRLNYISLNTSGGFAVLNYGSCHNINPGGTGQYSPHTSDPKLCGKRSWDNTAHTSHPHPAFQRGSLPVHALPKPVTGVIYSNLEYH